MDFYSHGGNIYFQNIALDFSSNISPLGMPPEVKEAAVKAVAISERYPDITYSKLREAIGSRLSVDPEYCICGNGASELIGAFIRAVRPRKALLLAPTFSEYEKALQSIRAECVFYPLKKQLDYVPDREILRGIEETEGLDMLVLCNPNNPTGALCPQELLEEILAVCVKKQIYMLADECFLEFTEKDSERTCLRYCEQYPRLFVLRAFTKLFAVPGLRLGYGVCSGLHDLDMEMQLPSWNVSSVAEKAGIAACGETAYIEQVKDVIRREQEYLTLALAPLVKKVYKPSANYIFFEAEKGLYQALLQKGILIRDCSNYRNLEEGYYRIAVRSHEENEKLLAALQEING